MLGRKITGLRDNLGQFSEIDLPKQTHRPFWVEYMTSIATKSSD